MTILAPSRPTAPAPSSTEREAEWDASNWLIVYLVLLLGIPETLSVASFGGSGSPANLFGILLFFRWLIARMRGTIQPVRIPLRSALGILAIAYVISGIAAGRRPITSLELNAVERALIELASWVGVALAAMDGLRTRERMMRVIKGAVIGGLVLAAIGVIEYATPIDPINYIQIPGLSPNNPALLGILPVRDGLTRVTGPTTTPIEYADILVMLIGLAIPLVLNARPWRTKRIWIVCMGAMLVAFPLGVARTGFIAFAVVLIWVVPTWPRSWRRWLLAATPLALVAGKIILPGVGGTIIGLFRAQANGSDSSASARTADYPVVWQYVLHRPFFGQGAGTFLPTIYRTLDNQVLLTVIEGGIVGLAAFFGVFVAAIRTTRVARRRITDRDDRLLGQCLGAVVAASMCVSFTFDEFSFSICTGLLFVTIGLCGSYYAVIAPPAPAPARPVGSVRRVSPSAGRGTALLIELAIVVLFGMWVYTAPPTWSSVTVIVVDQPVPNIARYHNTTLTGELASLLQDDLRSDEVQKAMAAAAPGASYTVALGQGSTQPGTDQQGSGPEMTLSVQSTDKNEIQPAMYQLTHSLTQELDGLQSTAKVSTSLQASLDTISTYPQPILKSRKAPISYALLLGLAIGIWRPLRGCTRRRRARVAAAAP